MRLGEFVDVVEGDVRDAKSLQGAMRIPANSITRTGVFEQLSR
jgi:hypothetical protein